MTRVEVSVDGCARWDVAELGPDAEQYAWRAWRWTWHAETPGRYELAARATDAAGNVQPVDPPWNRQGMANNHAQRVPVTVR